MKNLLSKDEKDRIDSICEKYNILNYSINSNGSIDVFGDVDLISRKLFKFPLKFGNVTGKFICAYNNLTSLVGCPTIVGGNFRCGHNKLSSLEGGPVTVGGDFFCSGNNLSSLVGSPTTVSGDFYCSNNKLTSLEGSPTVVDVFSCNENQLTNLIGGPFIVGSFYCHHNDLTSLEGAPTTVGSDFVFSYNKLTSTYAGDVDIEVNGMVSIPGNLLPQLIMDHVDHIILILKYQRHFYIWNDDLTLNEENFRNLISEIEDGLE
jgi:hypothetical protein